MIFRSASLKWIRDDGLKNHGWDHPINPEMMFLIRFLHVLMPSATGRSSDVKSNHPIERSCLPRWLGLVLEPTERCLKLWMADLE